MSLRREERSCRPIPTSSTFGLAYPHPQATATARKRKQRILSLPFGPGA